MQEPTEPAGSKDEICEEKVVLKAHSTRRSQRATTLTNETQTKPQVTTKASTEVKASDVESNKQGIDKTTSKQSILFQAKSPIRSTPVGLKINPWIADQANKVLLSRGQAALLLSQQKSAAVQGNRASKTKSHKPKEDAKNTLSKTKAQEGLEKARELIKKLRTLESDASKSKETSTSDKTERLHKLAKRQSSDGTSAESLSRRFEKKNLAQMMAVLPNSYDVQQVRNNARRKSFQDKLLVITKKHHQVFLKTLEVPLSIDDEKIIRWHPQFKLDDVPDIEQSVLPEAPEIKIYTTAQDVLDRGLGLMAPKVEKALKNVALKSKEKPKLDITYDSQPKGENNQVKNKNSKNSGVLKGISQDLLNKIRQKEAKKLEEKMMRDPILDKKMIMQERLPELCRILKTY
ncbi:hypothetical protein QZH41_006235 [Actinostola sp. cb2023]|nr:hypothetical protein QZH41_006235 [Actinostola sp. cb2023]